MENSLNNNSQLFSGMQVHHFKADPKTKIETEKKTVPTTFLQLLLQKPVVLLSLLSLLN